MKCQYVGWYSRRGCGDDAEPGEQYCHVHREQGKSNEMSAKIGGGCIWVALGVFAIVAFFLVCGIVA